MCFHMISPMKNVIALEGNSFERNFYFRRLKPC